MTYQEFFNKAKEKSLEIENMQEKISLVKKEVEDLQNKQNLACLDLGQVLYSNYRESYADFFKPFYDEISELKNLEFIPSANDASELIKKITDYSRCKTDELTVLIKSADEKKQKLTENLTKAEAVVEKYESHE